MDIITAKKELRTEFKKKRSSLSETEVTEKSNTINRNLITNLLPKIYSPNSNKVFSLYLSSGNEVQTNIIANFFTENNITFSYPKISNLTSPLDFIIYSNEQKFSPNKFFPKILEAENGKKTLPNIIILPLLAFDHNLQRLGMGGGFFDRTIEFLKKQQSKIVTVGLAYELQRSHQILPCEKTDSALDFIITEKNVFSRT
jgi:5-formyltetrahydrofolate cyclo-ligase